MPDFTDPKITLPILTELENLGLDDDRFQRLHHRGKKTSIKAHRKYCQKTERFLPGGTNEQTARRLASCLELRRAGEGWEIAILHAWDRFPK